MNTDQGNLAQVSGEAPTTREARLAWLAEWCSKNNVQLQTEGECGFGRECVGIVMNGTYPDYEWDDGETYERADSNGDVWTPPDAYHKHPCVAVLGRGEGAEKQLCEWLQWFDAHNFKVETGALPMQPGWGTIQILLGKDSFVRMVREAA